MAAEQGTTDALNASLVRSHATAPNEGWLAEARIDLAELNFARLGADAVAAEARDIGGGHRRVAREPERSSPSMRRTGHSAAASTPCSPRCRPLRRCVSSPPFAMA
jgi:hypothetical protein